jgi:hypothetical protein
MSGIEGGEWKRTDVDQTSEHWLEVASRAHVDWKLARIEYPALFVHSHVQREQCMCVAVLLEWRDWYWMRLHVAGVCVLS